jgi:acyl-coenzyme A synthetase/AMP-(fatty) acid ligase
MDKVFLVDKNVITYSQLISEINGNKCINSPTKTEKIIIKIIKNLISRRIQDYEDLLLNIRETNIKIPIHTSGTTGEPKTFYHTFESLSKTVKTCNSKRNNIWGFTYNPSKMAGYQVLFESILNKNTLVNLYELNYNEISSRIINHRVNYISGTPTFFRMLVTSPQTYPDVVHITLGGESSTLDTQLIIKRKFPNAKIKNVYASTEIGSLFITEGNVFKIPEKYKNFIKLDGNRLLVHRSLIAPSSIVFFEDDWYNTGDLVEKTNIDSFIFIGRSDSFINTGGYKVNMHNIENKILTLDYIQICKVYSKKNSVLGDAILCDLVLTRDVKVSSIKNDLKTILNHYEIPIKVNIVDTVKINENGKISRK